MTLAAPSPVRQRAGAGAEKPEGQKSKRQEARDKVGDKNMASVLSCGELLEMIVSKRSLPLL